jgi:nitroimidazol reductase NimA-like FMN-containing flavoprotein (pyridoxamine 5'-phosphate oxidase superfamily)
VPKQDARKAIRMTPAEAEDWLERGSTLSLATIDRDGYPHVVAMGYAMDKGDVVMTSFAKAQKVLNLRRNPKTAIMVESGKAYHTLKGVMIRGRGEIIEDINQVLNALRLVAHKAARLNGGDAASGDEQPSDPIVEQARSLAAKRVVIRIHPEKWASWDHSKLPPGKY